MGKIVAVTGVNSYFASTILPRLQADPEVESIIGIDVTPWKGGFDKVRFFKEDIRSQKIADILKGVDTVYHLAFVVGEIKDKEKTFDININGSKNVFSACAKNRVRKVIYTSSMTVYGAHKNNPLGFTEESPLAKNADNYYNSSKVDVENFVTDFFKSHPDIILTVIRAGLLCGPKINNMFSKLWEMKVTSLPLGRESYNQFIHEDDLGEALYLAYTKDIPGIYNVTADDAVATRWCFTKSGALIIPLPTPVLRLVANLAFMIGLFPASGGWASVSEYTIFGLSEKFKAATGWKPRYSSEETFLSYLASRKRDAKDNFIQATLSWVFKSGVRIKPTMAVLNIFRLGKVPKVREMIPWMKHEKNSMTYLPINKSLGQVANEAMPAQVVHDFIDRAKIHVIMDSCGCRLAGKCEHFTASVGCLFMGDTALKMPHGVSRRVTKEEAHKHVDRAVEVGLVPMTGKVRVDNFIFLTPDESRLLSVCFCCPCCCMMTAFQHIPGDYLDGIMPRIEGLEIRVTDKCVGCGKCLETCGFKAISIVNGRAVHDDHCRGCGRCERTCPNGAVSITIANKNYIKDVENRISSYVDFE